MAHEFRLADSISHQLRRVEQLASDRFAALEKTGAVTLRQFEVLAAIAESPGLSQSDLVTASGVDRSTLADMMSRMQKRGWITRETSGSDARANAVNLTPAGASILTATVQHARDADLAILDALSKPKAKAFQTALHKLVKYADEVSDAAQKKAARALRKKQRAEAKAVAAAEKAARKLRKKKKDEEPSRQS